MNVVQIAVLCAFAFLCIGGWAAAVVIGGMYLSSSKATWENEDESV